MIAGRLKIIAGLKNVKVDFLHSTCQLIDAESGQSLKSIQTVLPVLSVAFSPDGKYAVCTHADFTAEVWILREIFLIYKDSSQVIAVSRIDLNSVIKQSMGTTMDVSYHPHVCWHATP